MLQLEENLLHQESQGNHGKRLVLVPVWESEQSIIRVIKPPSYSNLLIEASGISLALTWIIWIELISIEVLIISYN